MSNIVVENGSIVSGANSYTTISGIDSYAADLGYSDWISATETNKVYSLFKGMRYIESFSFKGVRTTDGQSLSWPRAECYDKDGYLVEDDTIPSNLIKAVCEASIMCLPTSTVVLQPTITKDDYKSKVEIAGTITEEWDTNGRPLISRNNIINDLLQGYVKGRFVVDVYRGQ